MNVVFTAGSATDVGRVRQGNEDALYAGRRLWVVADGMGGHAAGEVASEVAVTRMAGLDDPDSTASAQPAAPVDPDALVDAILAAHDAILERSADDPGTEGMATTLTGVTLGVDEGQERLLVFNVGDSRTYRLTADRLVQVTVDHSEVQSLVDEGVLTPEEARIHPLRNLVSQCLGSRIVPRPDVFVLNPHPGDRYLICSDGLNGEVEDADLAAVLREHPEPQAAADALVAAALEAGGHDNVTVIVLNLDAAAE